MLTFEKPSVRNTPSASVSCRVVIRNNEGLSQVSQFVVEGLQIGQQVVAMAGPRFLRELARDLGESGLRPEGMLRNGRLVFLTAPNCLSTLLKPDESLQRGPVRSNAPLLRWVSDWSWAYGTSAEPTAALEFQRRVHDFIRSLDALSLCTAHSAHLERNSMLALLADHRRVSKAGDRVLKAGAAMGAGARDSFFGPRTSSSQNSVFPILKRDSRTSNS
jgi:hypothetical protein